MNGRRDFKTEDKTSVSRFADENELMETVQSWLKATPKSFFLESILKLVDRWTKCVAKQGVYIEK
jgi:hypothetical protein